MKDILFPSDNIYEIPCLRIDKQGSNLELPFVPYGSGRSTRLAKTIHFYVDDYRFASLWKNPAKILNTGASAVVEVNYSLYDTTPMALGLAEIYRKRWISRFLQENGLDVYVDLNVSSKFHNVNRLGIPAGYNAFATRGSRGHMAELEMEFEIAKVISGMEIPNLIVYGGGKEIHEFCNSHSLLYIHDFMTERMMSDG